MMIVRCRLAGRWAPAPPPPAPPRPVRTGCGHRPPPGRGGLPARPGAEAAEPAPGRGGGGLHPPPGSAPALWSCPWWQSRGKPAECSNGSEPGQK